MEIQTETHNVASILGMHEGDFDNPLALIKRIEEGFPTSVVDRVKSAMMLADRQVNELFVKGTTLDRRRKSGRLNSVESQKFERAARVLAAAEDVFRDQHTAREFLKRPHMFLDGQTPLDVAVGTDIGASMVEDILGRLKYGSAA
ncbi:MAG: DUF2384 domain-containing protein [Salinisphaeraceae bacterium]